MTGWQTSALLWPRKHIHCQLTGCSSRGCSTTHVLTSGISWQAAEDHRNIPHHLILPRLHDASTRMLKSVTVGRNMTCIHGNVGAEREGPRFNFLRAAHDQMRILLCKTWDLPPQAQALSTNLRQLLKKLTSMPLLNQPHTLRISAGISIYRAPSCDIFMACNHLRALLCASGSSLRCCQVCAGVMPKVCCPIAVSWF